MGGACACPAVLRQRRTTACPSTTTPSLPPTLTPTHPLSALTPQPQCPPPLTPCPDPSCQRTTPCHHASALPVHPSLTPHVCRGAVPHPTLCRSRHTRHSSSRSSPRGIVPFAHTGVSRPPAPFPLRVTVNTASGRSRWPCHTADLAVAFVNPRTTSMIDEYRP